MRGARCGRPRGGAVPTPCCGASRSATPRRAPGHRCRCHRDVHRPRIQGRQQARDDHQLRRIPPLGIVVVGTMSGKAEWATDVSFMLDHATSTSSDGDCASFGRIHDEGASECFFFFSGCHGPGQEHQWILLQDVGVGNLHDT